MSSHKRYLLVFLIFSCIIHCCFSSSLKYVDESVSQVKPLRHRIDLDKPLEEQYAKIYTHYQKELLVYKNFLYSNPHIQRYIGYSKLISWFQSYQWHQEIKMFSKITGLDEEFFILYNMGYNLYCTSIVVRNENNEVFLGRNLDYPGTNEMGAIVLEYEYYINGELKAIAASAMGYLGFMNAVKPGKFTVSINQRDREHNSSWWYIARFAYGYPDPLYNLKLITLNSLDYNDALTKLGNTPINSPVYYIISGVNPNEGAIVTRNSSGIHLLESLTPDLWFLVQTNYDRDLPDPEKDYRRIPAENKLIALGKNITANDLFKGVMSQGPNREDDTIFTTIQSANSTLFDTVIWNKTQ